MRHAVWLTVPVVVAASAVGLADAAGSGGLDLTQLGVAGTLVTVLMADRFLIWTKYQAALKLVQDNQDKAWPALIAATQAMSEVAKVSNRLENRERGR